jgi:predicted ArsR family transcriptional regulator
MAVADREDLGTGTTIGALAADLGGHANTSRVHVGELVSEGLLERVAVAGSTRGRPAHEHRLTDRGRIVLDALRFAEPVATDELVSAMAEHLAATPDAEAHARAIGRLWATQLTREPDTDAGRTAERARPRRHRHDSLSPTDLVTTLLRTAGFSPQAEASGDVALLTCPVLTSARAHPGVVCTMHEEMLRAALDDAGDTDVDVDVQLVPFAREGACLVHLTRR